MLKKVDVAVFDTIKEVVENRFVGGIKIFGLKENGVGFVYDNNNASDKFISEITYKKVMELKNKIINGDITIELNDR